MATKSTKEPEIIEQETTAPQEEHEEIFVPPSGVGQERDLVICINGRRFIMPKGQTSRVPKYVADEYRRSLAAQAAGDRHVNEMIQMGQHPMG